MSIFWKVCWNVKSRISFTGNVFTENLVSLKLPTYFQTKQKIVPPSILAFSHAQRYKNIWQQLFSSCWQSRLRQGWRKTDRQTIALKHYFCNFDDWEEVLIFDNAIFVLSWGPQGKLKCQKCLPLMTTVRLDESQKLKWRVNI